MYYPNNHSLDATRRANPEPRQAARSSGWSAPGIGRNRMVEAAGVEPASESLLKPFTARESSWERIE
jgi:hypothetical protein